MNTIKGAGRGGKGGFSGEFPKLYGKVCYVAKSILCIKLDLLDNNFVYFFWMCGGHEFALKIFDSLPLYDSGRGTRGANAQKYQRISFCVRGFNLFLT